MIPRSAVLLTFCCLGLVGCANLQSKLGRTAPGTAATASPSIAPPPVSLSAAAPPLDLNEGAGAFGPIKSTPADMPPPPPPPAPGLTLGPLEGKKDAPAVRTVAKNSAPSKMYNLGGGPKESAPAKVVASKSENKTLQKLSGKSSVAKAAEPVEVKEESTSKESAPKETAKPESGSILERLAKSSAEREGQVSEQPKEAATSLPAPAPVEQSKPAAEEAPAPAPAKSTASDEGFDTGFLAQPVRKGASAEPTTKKEPQSSVIPKNSDDKTAIRPVSNPYIDKSLDTERFS